MIYVFRKILTCRYIYNRIANFFENVWVVLIKCSTRKLTKAEILGILVGKRKPLVLLYVSPVCLMLDMLQNVSLLNPVGAGFLVAPH